MYLVDLVDSDQEPNQRYSLSAVDMTTGETLWRQVRFSVDVAGVTGSIAVVQFSGTVHGLDAKTGRVLWTHYRDGKKLWPHREVEGVVIVESQKVQSYPQDSQAPYMPEWFPIDEFCVLNVTDGEALWCEQVEEGDDVTPLGDLVYLTSGNMGRVFDARTGAQVRSWEGRGGVDGDAPELIRGDGLYLNDFGTISLLESITGPVRWQYEWDWIDAPSMRAAGDDLVILWTGAGFAAVGIPPSGGIYQTPIPSHEGLCENGVVVPNPEDNPGLVGDCEVLLSIEEALVGDLGTLRAETELNWSADLPISEWEGVWVNWPSQPTVVGGDSIGTPTPRDEGLPPRVFRLELYSKELRGSIPARLGDLEELVTLVLGSIYHYSSIPPELGRLEHLETLMLLGSQLTGPIPVELSNLKRLKSVDIDGYGFTGCLPTSWDERWITDSSGAELAHCE